MITSIPLQMISLDGDGYHLLLKIKLFREQHFAVLDTGASRSVFDKSLIERHITEFTTIKDMQANTLFSTAEAIQATIPELRIGRLKISNYQSLSLDLSSVTETYAQFGHPAVAAIVGGDILVQYHARIDYEKMILRLKV